MHGRVCFNGYGVRRGIVAAAMAVLGLTATSHAQTTITLRADDATLRGGNYANTNYGNGVLATRSSSDASYERRALLKFDTHTTIPSGATISSARLYLTVAGGNTDSRRVGAYCVTGSFDEWATTWRKRKSSTYWSTAGGDTAHYHATASVTSTRGTQVSWDVTAQVQEVVNRSSSRYARMLLVDLDGSSRSSYKEYYSSEASDASVRPRLVVTYGGSTASLPTTSTSTLKVLDWNIHHGVDTGGTNNLERVATWIANINPHVVSLNEVEKLNGYNNNADEPAVLKSKLQTKTGRTWYTCWAQRYGGTNGQGNLILSRIRIESCDDYVLSYGRSVARARITVNGRAVNVFSTHLDADSSSRRATQISQLKSWASGYSEQRIAMGDFNAWPGASEIDRMESSYFDAWAEAKADGTTVAYSGNEAGNTRNSRIDYVWFSRGASALRLTRAQVYNTGTISDHRPVSATFDVR